MPTVTRLAPSSRPALRTLPLLLLAALSACGRQPEGPEVHPVRGRLLVQGQSAAGAFVVFHPTVPIAGIEAPPTAQVASDGSFALTTRGDNDGAPAGQYNVTVEWYRLVTASGDITRGPNVVPPAYARPDTTPLHIAVNPGENNLEPIQIRR